MEKKTTQNIMSMDLDEIRIMVKKHGINVCIIGIGRIGLPTAITFANFISGIIEGIDATNLAFIKMSKVP